MNKKRINRNIFFGCLILAFLLCGISSYKAFSQNRFLPQREIDFNKGWYTQKQQITLPKRVQFDGDMKITIERKLSGTDLLEEKMLCFISKNCTLQVEFDGSILYVRSTPVFGWNFVTIPGIAENADLKITFFPEYESNLQIPQMLLGDSAQINQHILLRYLPYLIMDILLLLLGIAMFLYSFYIKRRQKIQIHYSCVMIGIAAILCAAVLRYGAPDFPNIAIGDPLAQIFARCTFFLIPIPFIFLFWDRAKPTLKIWYNVLFFVSTANFFAEILSCFLQLKSSLILINIEKIIYAIIFLTILFHYIYYYIRKRITLGKTEVMGVTVFLLGLFTEFLHFFTDMPQGAGVYFRLGLTIYLASLAITSIRTFLAQKETIARNAQKDQEMQTMLMLSQIKPHFLFNALGAIRVMIKVDPDRAYDLIYDFSKCLRSNLNSLNNQDPIPFSAELEYIRAYINIEKLRFGEKIAVSYDIQATDFKIPALCIQPIVENAIKHGICKKVEGGRLLIKTYRAKNHYCVIIEDNGTGFRPEEIHQQNTPSGLINIQNKLNHYLDTGLKISSSPGKGTRITLILPEKYERKFGHENDFSR